MIDVDILVTTNPKKRGIFPQMVKRFPYKDNLFPLVVLGYIKTQPSFSFISLEVQYFLLPLWFLPISYFCHTRGRIYWHYSWYEDSEDLIKVTVGNLLKSEILFRLPRSLPWHVIECPGRLPVPVTDLIHMDPCGKSLLYIEISLRVSPEIGVYSDSWYQYIIGVNFIP